MDLIREVMVRNFQISLVTNRKSDFKARGTQMGRPYPAQYLGRGVPGSKLRFRQQLDILLYEVKYVVKESKKSEEQK